MPTKLLAKIALLGDGGVGKTSLRERFVKGEFTANYMLTVGADFAMAEVPMGDYLVKFQIWDLAGQPRFSAVRGAYYTGAKGVLIVYDVTRVDSLKNIISWLEECFRHVKPKPPIVLVGNKIDLRDKVMTPTVSPKIGENLAYDLHDIFKIPVIFFETSAKDDVNVSEAFEMIAKLIIKDIEED